MADRKRKRRDAESAKPVRGWALTDREGRIIPTRVFLTRRRIVAVTIVSGHVVKVGR